MWARLTLERGSLPWGSSWCGVWQSAQAAVQAKQAKGEKGPVKRAKAKNLPPAKPRTENEPAPVATAPAPAATGKAKHAPKAQTAICPEVMKALISLLEDVPAEDMNDVEGVAVVKVKKLLKLASFMVTEDEAASVAANF